MPTIGDTDVRLGCQSFTEPDWRGTFYPQGLKPADRLSSYASAFDFVEIDSSFYAVPRPGSVIGWRESSPEGFLFSAKLPQAITHDPDPKTNYPRRPLESEGWRETLDRFVETFSLLGDKLGAVVAQLPPQWHYRPERMGVLERFLAALPEGIPWAVEFRHRAWLNDDTMELLKAHGVALVLQDLYYMPRLVEATTQELAYIRLQGRRKEITSMDQLQIERDGDLDFWASAIVDLAAQGVRRVILAANNHYQGHSPGTIAALQGRLGFTVGTPPARRTSEELTGQQSLFPTEEA